MLFIWYGIFAHPHPEVTCMYPIDGISRLWGMGIFIGFIIAICIYGYFYFLSLPTKNALKKYWILFFIVPALISILLSSIIILNEETIIDELCVQEMSAPTNTIVINIILASLITALEINIITAVLFIIVGKIPIKSRMRAMRNYPIKF